MKHIMVDLETWGLIPGSDIRSIGAVVFDPVAGTLGDEFYVNLSNPEVGKLGTLNMSNEIRYWDAASECYRKYPLTRDPSTVAWWGDQSEAAQAVLLHDPVLVHHALAEFSCWWSGQQGDDVATFWANGPHFDEQVLAACYRAIGLSLPWSYRAPRDCRTIYEAAGGIDLQFEGVPHYALDDAKHQARCVIEAYRKLREPAVTIARATVYAAINRERDYQDQRWSPETTISGGLHSIGEWLLFMDDYLAQAKREIARNSDPAATDLALHTIRKITTLGVACMEQHGVREREA